MSDILTQTFCIYCQREFASPENLQRHVERSHKYSYADHAIKEARKAKSDA